MAKIKAVRVVKTKYGTYSLHFTNPTSRRRRLSVGRDYNQAQRLVVRFMDWLLEGKDPEVEIEKSQQEEQSRSITIKDFFPIFMKRHGAQRSLNMQISYNSSFKNVFRCKPLLNMGIGSISRGLVLDYAHARMEQDGVSPATVNREIAFLKCILSFAVESDVLEHNPLQGLKLFSEAEKREVKLTPERASELLAELPKPMASIVEFALYTGFRKENILELCIEQIHFHDITKTGEAELIVKGGRKEIFPLSPLAVEVLKRVIGNRKKGFVFICPQTGTRYKSVQKSFNNAVRKLSLTVNGTKLRFHDLRHVFGTWLHQAGIDIDTISQLLGHRDRKTTDRYITFNRLSYSGALNVIPRIERGFKEDNSIVKTESLKKNFGKNWQDKDRDYLTSLPQTAVNP